MGSSSVVPTAVTVTAMLLAALVMPERASGQQDSLQALPVLTLDQALSMAGQGNVSVANAQLGVKKATATLDASKTGRFPTLSLDALASYSFLTQDYTIDQGAFGTYPVIGPIPNVDTTITSVTGPHGTASVSLTQPILQQYRIGLIIDQRRLIAAQAEQNLRGQTLDMVKSVKDQYYQILSTQSQLQASEASVAFYRELATLVQHYVEQEVAQEYESMETQARLAKAQHQVRSERNALETEEERLNNLLGRDPKTRFRVVDQAPAQLGGYPTMAVAESLALVQRPDVQQKRLQLQEAEKSHAITKSDYLPTLNFTMRYSQLFNTSFLPTQDWSMALLLRWDIYDWGKKKQDLRKDDADIAQAENDIRDITSQATLEVDTRIRSLDEAEEMVSVTRLSQVAATEKLRVLTNQYQQQTALLKDVLQAAAELADANTSYQQALLSVWTARSQLDKALGES